MILAYGSFLLWPSLIHEPKPFVSLQQVEALKLLQEKVPPSTKVLNWWDDSYVIPYYAKRNSVMPYNSFGGEMNHWMSKLLLSPPSKHIKQDFWGKLRLNHHTNSAIYLPFELLLKLGNIQRFSHLQSKENDRLKEKGFLILNIINIKDEEFIFDNGYTLDRASFTLRNQETPLPFGDAHILTHAPSGLAHVKSSTFNSNYLSDLLYIPSRKLMILMERDFYNSLVVQMGILHRYDPRLIEAITLMPDVSIYRWKYQRSDQN
jgi:hypothetical protein